MSIFTTKLELTLSETPDGVSQNPKPLGRRGKERGTGGKEFPRRPRFRKFALTIKKENMKLSLK
jgi:hypothetical protein